VTIDGAPNNGHVTINGNHIVRGFLVNPGKTFNVQNLTIANGRGNDCPPSSTGSCGGGICNDRGTLNVTNVTLMGNTATDGGGGIYTTGGLIITVANSTFVDNSSAVGGGIVNEVGGALNITNCTFSGNTASNVGGGIANIGAETNLKNTIVAGSTGGACYDVVGSIIADSHNLATDGTCGDATTKTAAEINLQPLADNGGHSMTMALQLPSAAVDTGDNAVAAAPPVNNLDQRGAARPADGDNNGSMVADVGAYELQPSDGCTVCHKHNTTLFLPCNGLDYRRHLDHGDPPNACTQLGLPRSKSTRD
jgi:predicted outer membrane repeat protein